ncbi:MAG: pyridoxal phosphate-dependent aminotransferase [Marinovum algicola]|uniref:Histidinol-phosphate aminotransferase n=1 Tax=Marinovum algicola TaxID=42444 RepID=A0A975W9D5_9RHOB|nr:pyridoxal phosphate-dependent aminotransferase [Marinovum algicola]SEJ34560.1 histidinol-phosphate aminotransferase [Marinovum algicola]SLN38490.1 Histidinol-phosphate aminotransferase [Marinovum algicola]
MRGPRFTDIVAALPPTVPFVGPEQMERDRGAPFVARLGANESVFGPSPLASRAMQAADAEIWKYGDSTSFDLRHALAEDLGIGADNIVLGAGIDGLLESTVRLMVGPGDQVVTSDGAYPTFNFHVAGHGGTLHRVPYRDDHEDTEALLAKARAVGAKLIYLANPDNPMGSWLSAAQVEAMIAALPAGCVLVLDEAYVEFAPEDSVPAFDVTDPAVLRFRTFSKAHGMAGARVGYAIGQADVIAAYEKVRNHFGMNRSAQAGALAALQDRAWLARVQRDVATARDRIAAIARDNGLRPLASATNFVAVDCGADGGFARRVLTGLLAQGVFVRMPFVAPEDRCIRISAGTPEMLDAFAAALPEALAVARRG